MKFTVTTPVTLHVDVAAMRIPTQAVGGLG